MNIIEVIKDSVFLFLKREYFEKFICILKDLLANRVVDKKFSILDKLKNPKNYWEVLSDFIDSGEIVDRYLLQKAISVRKSFQQIKKKYGFQEDIIINIYIFLCKKEINSLHKDQIIINQSEKDLYNSFARPRGNKKKKTVKSMEKLGIAQLFIEGFNSRNKFDEKSQKLQQKLKSIKGTQNSFFKKMLSPSLQNSKRSVSILGSMTSRKKDENLPRLFKGDLRNLPKKEDPFFPLPIQLRLNKSEPMFKPLSIKSNSFRPRNHTSRIRSIIKAKKSIKQTNKSSSFNFLKKNDLYY